MSKRDLSDMQKLTKVQDLMDDLTGKYDVGVCGCEQCANTPYIHGSYSVCPECKSKLTSRRPMNAHDFLCFNDVERLAFCLGSKDNIVGGLFYMGWGGILNTAVKTVSVPLQDGEWETFNLPPQKSWAFNFDKWLSSEAQVALA
jgi:hypothetical protein